MIRKEFEIVGAEMLGGIAAFLGGLALGAFFFGGLWITIQRMPAARHPALLVLGSFLIRTFATAVGFYFIMGGEWMRAVIALAGFITIRMFMVRRGGHRTVPVSSQEEIQENGR